LPIELRRLLALDQAASIAEAKGRADSEVEAAAVVRDAAMGGDSKAAMALLTHLHEWQPKQQISIDIKSQISITAALQEAESRVIEGRVLSNTELALDHDDPPRLTALDKQVANADL
jgi:hypothetical protein